MDTIDNPDANDGASAWLEVRGSENGSLSCEELWAVLSPAAGGAENAGFWPCSLLRSKKPAPVRSFTWDCLDPGMRGGNLLSFIAKTDTSINCGNRHCKSITRMLLGGTVYSCAS